MNLPSLLNCSCTDKAGSAVGDRESLSIPICATETPKVRGPKGHGLISYSAGLDLPLVDPPLHSGEVLLLQSEDAKVLEPVKLHVYANGLCIKPLDASRPGRSAAWSPFCLVQACRLHSLEADAAIPWLRLFKVSIFHHGCTFFFAASGKGADADRARWVADISRILRLLTQSLIPAYSISCEPVSGAEWTVLRLLSGYLLLCDERGISLIYCELQAHWDGIANFAAYEDSTCEVEVLHVAVQPDTCVSERVGIDCSCFSVAGHNLTCTTSAEKILWLRAISNVKVKLRHRAANPAPIDLRHYREAIKEFSEKLPRPTIVGIEGALLPRRILRRRQPTPIEPNMVGIVSTTAPSMVRVVNTSAPVNTIFHQVAPASSLQDLPPPPPFLAHADGPNGTVTPGPPPPPIMREDDIVTAVKVTSTPSPTNDITNGDLAVTYK